MAQMFKINDTQYTTNEAGTYFYKTGTNGKKWRIAKCEYEQAFEEYVNQKADEADVAEWENEMEEAKQEARKEQEKSDKAAEDALNIPKSALKANERYIEKTKGEKKVSKPRRSKDVALESNGVTLTAKQVDFLKEMTKTSFYEAGIDSVLWCDVLTEEIGGQFGGKPMTVGAMISTLREKGIVSVGRDRVNGRMAKCMGFTDLGKEIAKDLGL